MIPPNAVPDSVPRDLCILSTKDKPWERHRTETDTLQVTLATSDQPAKNFSPERYAVRMCECSQSLRFNITETPERKFKLFSAKFCRVPICPICQWRKTLKWTSRFIQGFTKLVQVHPDHKYLFLTLTIPNCPIESLRSKIELMVKSWNKLTKRKCFPAVGFIRSLEVTRNPETGYAHPHFHCLLMVPPSYFAGRNYLSQARWTDLWRESLQLPPGSPCIVNVKKVKPKKAKADPLEGQGETTPVAEIINGILEVAKYTVKVSDLLADTSWCIQMADQIYKLTKVTTGGLIKKFVNDLDTDTEDLVHLSEDSIELLEADYQLIFDWNCHVQKYLSRITA